MTLINVMRRHAISALILFLGFNGSAYLHGEDYGYNVLRVPDQVKITAVNGTLLALNSINGGNAYVRLAPGEELRYCVESGIVGIALTNFRILGFSAPLGSWSWYRFFLDEFPLNDGMRLSSRLALLVTTRKALVFDSGTGSWIQTNFPPFDLPLGFDVTENLALVFTERKVFGYSAAFCGHPTPGVRGWSLLDLRIKEPIVDIAMGDTLATLDTPQRRLVFDPASGWSWVAKTRLF